MSLFHAWVMYQEMARRLKDGQAGHDGFQLGWDEDDFDDDDGWLRDIAASLAEDQ